MIIGDREIAGKHLERIGYYRLKAYWFPFMEPSGSLCDGNGAPNGRTETFRPETEFRYGVELYIFDKKLRLLLLDAIERIEVALRVAIAHTVGLRGGAFAHKYVKNLDPNLAIRIVKDDNDEPIAEEVLTTAETPITEVMPIAVEEQTEKVDKTAYGRWARRARFAETRSKADWVLDYRRIYGKEQPLPLWMAVELWDFGQLSKFLEMARTQDRMTIASKFALPNPAILASWVKTLAVVRNMCAHHSRVWNNPLAIQPKILPSSNIPRMEHVAASHQMRSRIYAATAVAQHFLDTTNPKSQWKHRLRSLWAEFPDISGVSAAQAGFIDGWETQPIWNF